VRLELKIYRGKVFQWTDRTEVAKITIGRAADNRIRLDDPSVDDHHGTLTVDAERRVRYTAGDKEELSTGDSLFVGVFRIEVRFDRDASSRPNIVVVPATSMMALVPIKALRQPALKVSEDLHACRTCGYWCEATSEYCADCGKVTEHPKSTWRRKTRWYWRKLGAGGVGVWGLAVGAIVGLGPLGLVGIAVAGAGIGAFFGNQMGDYRVERRLLSDKASDSLDATTLAIEQALEANRAFVERIAKSRKTLAEIEDLEERAETVAMLDRKVVAREAEHDALTVRRWSVEFARWANCYLPVYFDLERVTFEETEQRIAFTRQVEATGRAMLELWRRERAAATARAQELVAAFEEAIAGLAVIRGQLARANAQLADPEATHLPNMPVSDALRDELAKFQTLCDEIAGGRFSSGIAEIEAERLRLEAEAEVANDV